MNKITQSSVKELMEYEGESVLTLYVPTHRFSNPPNIQEDQIRFKNLIRQGCEQWRTVRDESEITETISKLEALLDDLNFWQDTLETLAIFVRNDSFEIYHLPIECEERVHVGKRFDITPVLIVESMNQPHYVFALAMHEPKLYTADLYGLEPVEIDFPKSPEDALNIDEMFSNSNTIRSGRQSVGGTSVAASPHGQGDANGAGTEERLMYFRILDDKIRSMKNFDTSKPVIIAATDSEFGDYRSHSQLKIVDTHIPGNYTAVAPQDLHEQVMTLLYEKQLGNDQRDLMARVADLQGVQKSSYDVAEMTPASETGRIDTLLLGMIDMTTDSVSDNRQPKPLIRYFDHFDKTVHQLVMNTIKNGGSIAGVMRGRLPYLSSAAALYRY